MGCLVLRFLAWVQAIFWRVKEDLPGLETTKPVKKWEVGSKNREWLIIGFVFYETVCNDSLRLKEEQFPQAPSSQSISGTLGMKEFTQSEELKRPLFVSTGREEEELQGNVTYLISPSSSSGESLSEEDKLQLLQDIPVAAAAAAAWKKRKRAMSKQLSMIKTECESETPRDMAWERRRRQIQTQEQRRNSSGSMHDVDEVTDEDLNELKGSIELGFGFNEEDGQTLCNTLPALDLYFAVNRQVSGSTASTPRSICCHSRRSSFGSPGVPVDSDSWKICNPGDDPKHVKTKLRHWAQAVACSVIMQTH
ncbi:uncharacterized protein DS421_16g536200 [Arachis hypogaea]|nr:uncharacterized protein DS421_16g536200 [Arachis hypogaea]